MHICHPWPKPHLVKRLNNIAAGWISALLPLGRIDRQIDLCLSTIVFFISCKKSSSQCHHLLFQKSKKYGLCALSPARIFIRQRYREKRRQTNRQTTPQTGGRSLDRASCCSNCQSPGRLAQQQLGWAGPQTCCFPSCFLTAFACSPIQIVASLWRTPYEVFRREYPFHHQGVG